MTIRYLLDTNIVSFVLKGKAPNAEKRLASLHRDSIGVSVITAMELQFGLEKSTAGQRYRVPVELFLSTVHVVPLPAAVAPHYGRLRAALERRGRPIGALDMIIAAHALALDATLVTNNSAEFKRVPKLRCEDWS